MTQSYDGRYDVSFPATPGAARTVQIRGAESLKDARAFAHDQTHDRRDLTYQDVRIERPDGSLVEYAGPAR